MIVYGLSLLASAIQTYVLSGFSHRASFKTQSDGTFRVSIPTHLTWHAGQHVFVRFYSGALGAGNVLTNHPFSICSLPSQDKTVPSEIVFYIRPHTGITRCLSNFSKEHPDETIPVLVEGPYGGVDKEALDGFERYLLIAGGSGGGSVLPILEHLTRRASRMPMPKDEEGASGPAARIDARVVCVMRYRGELLVYCLFFSKASNKSNCRIYPLVQGCGLENRASNLPRLPPHLNIRNPPESINDRIQRTRCQDWHGRCSRDIRLL